MAQKLIRKLEAGTGGIQHMDRYYHSNPKGLWDEIMFDVKLKMFQKLGSGAMTIIF